MGSAIANFAIAVGVTSAICYALMTRVENQRRRRGRAGGEDDGDSSYSGTNHSFGVASWFSSSHSALDGSGNPIDGGSCSFGGDSSDGAGGDCGGGGDGGGGGGD